MCLALLCRNSQKRWLRLWARQPKGYVNCPPQTPQTKWQQNVHSEGTENSSSADRSQRENKSPSRKRPRKTSKCNKSTYRSRWRAAMEKPCTWRTKSSHSFIPCGICSLYILVFEVAKRIMKCLSKISAWTRTDDQGTEYVTFEENPTKTRQGGLRKKRRAIQPKMLATGGPHCPVQFFKTYLAHRPEEMQNSGTFYLVIIECWKTEIRSVVQETKNGCY